MAVFLSKFDASAFVPDVVTRWWCQFDSSIKQALEWEHRRPRGSGGCKQRQQSQQFFKCNCIRGKTLGSSFATSESGLLDSIHLLPDDNAAFSDVQNPQRM
jgi:hypothetical protein